MPMTKAAQAISTAAANGRLDAMLPLLNLNKEAEAQTRVLCSRSWASLAASVSGGDIDMAVKEAYVQSCTRCSHAVAVQSDHLHNALQTTCVPPRTFDLLLGLDQINWKGLSFPWATVK